mgnify:CR=1 FL=1
MLRNLFIGLLLGLFVWVCFPLITPVHPPMMAWIGALVDAVAARHPGQPALEDATRRLTYSELATARERVASGLQAAGLRAVPCPP